MKQATELGELLESLYDGNPDAIVVYDATGRFVAANPAAYELTGTALSDHIFGAEHARLNQAVATVLEGGLDHFETSVKHKTGTVIPVECFVFPAKVHSRVVGAFAVARDIIALRSAEHSLGINQERFRSLFEYHPDAIMSLKSTGDISRVNVALESATGYYGEQIIGRPWTDLIAPEDRAPADRAFRCAMRDEAGDFEAQFLDRLGNRIDVQVSLVPLHVGELIEGVYAIAKNVTAQRAAERAIVEQNERIRGLYLVAAARGESIAKQIDDTLALGCRLFGFDYGYVARIADDRRFILNAVGQDNPIPVGDILERQLTFERHLSAQRNSLFIQNSDEAPWNADPAHARSGWKSFFGTELYVNGAAYGALIFAGRLPLPSALVQGDRDLAQLMSLFIAAALERAHHEERINQLAFHDSLTGLPNRVLFEDRIKQTIATAKRYNRGFAVMYLDLDHFKAINDAFGHPVGDLVLKAVSDRLRANVRESDTVARFGGDEFVILQPIVDGFTDSADLARKIITTMQAPYTLEHGVQELHTSIGIALYPQDASGIDELMDKADKALYRAKHAGRNRWSFTAEEDRRQAPRSKSPGMGKSAERLRPGSETPR
ncbi:MAG: sensor domain-containing diguanylate cyclase [Candidatus Baltobacteraceae bacterium]